MAEGGQGKCICTAFWNRLPTRWHKLLRDLRAERGRVLLMIIAIAVSLVGVTSVLGAYAILTREIAVNYLGTHPATATLELDGHVTDDLVAQVKTRPGIREAEARDVLRFRVKVGEDWHPLLLFVVDSFNSVRMNTFRLEQGAWPPPVGDMLIERTAVGMMQTGLGQQVRIQTPQAHTRDVTIAGLVHDPGLAPAWQERMGYGYVERAILAQWGESSALHELRVDFQGAGNHRSTISHAAQELSTWLNQRGNTVHEIRVPPPGQHPHQRQMQTVLLMMLSFSGLTLVLSGILVAALLAAMLARQVREIGVMKTLGARTIQIVTLYLLLVGTLGGVAALLSWLPGQAGARFFARSVAVMLNLVLTDEQFPIWVMVVMASGGVVVPTLLAAVPILRASRVTIREAIDHHGVSRDTLTPRFSVLHPVLRNMVRRPGRLALTLTLLAMGGALFMTALNMRNGWEQMLDKFYQARQYDWEIRLHTPQPAALVERLRHLPGVGEVEPWGYSSTAFAQPGQVDLTATYPDRGHASFSLFAPPPATDMVHFPLLAGRWLQDGDDKAVVLNHSAHAQAKHLQIGDAVTLAIDGRPTPWIVRGIVEEIGHPPAAYVADTAFAQVVDNDGSVRMLRIATTAQSPAQRVAMIRAIEGFFEQEGIGVEHSMPLTEHRTAIADHIAILVRALVAMAMIMGMVGTLGLGSTMSINVVERTRELGIMKSLGATPAFLKRLLISEAVLISLLSGLLAILLAAPLTGMVGWLIGTLGFLAPLPFVMAPLPMLGWLLLVATLAILATWIPARQAGKLPIVQALACG